MNLTTAEFTAVLTQGELEAWGERIGREAELPLVVVLHGDLGAGKSTLARAIARGAGVGGAVPSPTFNLLFAYDTPRGRVLHFDLYRLRHPDEVWELGWEEVGSGPQLVLVEWAERAAALLPEPRWEVTLAEAADPGRRCVAAVPVGGPPPVPPPLPPPAREAAS
jgi:tRNA threonylcarbamoyladenosine biosynthesis protein TsaE